MLAFINVNANVDIYQRVVFTSYCLSVTSAHFFKCLNPHLPPDHRIYEGDPP